MAVLRIGVFVALAVLLVSCGGGAPPSDGDPQPSVVPIVEYEHGSTGVAEVPASGRVDVVSGSLGVRYELTVEGEGGAGADGVRLEYRENERGRSEFLLTDSRSRFAPFILVGTPDEIAAVLGTEVAPVGSGVEAERSLVVSATIVGVIGLVALAKKFSDYGKSYSTVQAFMETGDDLCDEADVYCTCSTITDVVALQAAASKMDSFASGFTFSLLLKGVGDLVGGVMQVPGVTLDVASLTGLDGFLARQFIEDPDLGEGFEGLTADEPVLVRLMAFEDADGERIYSWRGVQVMQRGCDLGAPGVAMVVDLEPMPADPGRDLRFDVALTGGDVAGVQVALAVRAVASSLGFERMLVGTTDSVGRVSFEVPPFYHSLTAEYAVIAPQFDLVVSGSFDWAMSSPNVARPRPTLWYFRPDRSTFEAPGRVTFRYFVSQVHEEPAARTDLTCMFDPGDGGVRRPVECLGFLDSPERLGWQHEYTSPGVYEASLEVVNRDGASDALTVPITVSGELNTAPEVLAFGVSPSSPDVGQPVQFDWSVRDLDGDLVSCLLDFGDGSAPVAIDPCGLNESVVHVYGEASDEWGYWAVLSAVDRRGTYAPSRIASVAVGTASDVSVSLVPASVTLPVNGSQSFTATVTGASDASVTWSATCGSISGSGSTVEFTAPSTPSECSVRATSASGTWAEAAVTVEGSTGAVHFGDVHSIAAGRLHTLAVLEDGSVWAWGSNEFGQLGDGTTVQRSSPVQVVGLSNVRSVAAGIDHSLAVREDGSVWSWGRNLVGELGDGTTVQRLSPVQVVGLSGVRSVAAGSLHSLAAGEDGSVWAWGWNDFGQLGDGTRVQRLAPVQVAGLSDVRSVAGHRFHSIASRADGSAWAWGLNSRGRLGDGTDVQRLTPVQVVGVSSVRSVAAGADHSLVVRENGSVWAWGSNLYGQLGDGSTVQRLSPVEVPGLSNVRSVAAGAAHSLVVRENGSVWAWGSNLYGQLGDGSTVQRLSPVQVVDLSSVRSVAGSFQSGAVLDDGTLFMWGLNSHGQLGNGITEDQLRPAPVLSGE